MPGGVRKFRRAARPCVRLGVRLVACRRPKPLSMRAGELLGSAWRATLGMPTFEQRRILTLERKRAAVLRSRRGRRP